jgi:hypothetical protein
VEARTDADEQRQEYDAINLYFLIKHENLTEEERN